MDAKKVLTHLVKAGRDALHLEKTLNSLGYKATPYYNLHGEIADAIYCMLDENTESFDQSKTYAAMNDIFTADEACAEELAGLIDQDKLESQIPKATYDFIVESANERGIDVYRFINIILSDWAGRELIRRSLAEQK